MAKLHKVVVYLIDTDDMSTPRELDTLIDNDKYICGEIGKVSTVDIGEWYDEIDINQQSSTIEDLEKYFVRVKK